MTNKNFLLSIAIPTYNRSIELNQLLGELFFQLEKCTFNLEICVSDNASSDGTSNVIQRYLDRKPDNLTLKYFLNHENLGGDKNIELVINRSAGEYIWLLCDDDLPAPDAIKRLHTLISERKESNISLFFINRSIENLERTEVIVEREHEINNDICFADGKDLFDKFLSSILTASCLVLKKEACCGEIKDKFINGYHCSPMALALQALKNGKGYFVSSPLVIYREGDRSSWSYLAFTIYFYFIPFIIKNVIVFGFDESSYKKIIDERVCKHDFKVFLFDWKFTTDKRIQENINWMYFLYLYKNEIIKKPSIVLYALCPKLIVRIFLKIERIILKSRKFGFTT